MIYEPSSNPFERAMDDSSGVHYVFVTLLGTGMPWSEQEAGVSFLRWACSCFGVDANEFSWMECPGDQNMEFTTALPTRAGINPLVKPRAALSRDYPTEKLRPASCGRLSLRNVKARHDLRPVLYPTRLTNLNKIWVAQRVSRPLQIEAVDRMSFFRSHPNELFDVFPSESPDIERNVMKASKTVLEWAKAELKLRLDGDATKKRESGAQPGGRLLERPARYSTLEQARALHRRVHAQHALEPSESPNNCRAKRHHSGQVRLCGIGVVWGLPGG